MKTAMQEHIEWLKSRMEVTDQIEKELLKKEKEQIIDAYIISRRLSSNFLNDKSADDYYKDTYIQN
jgi:hypothetical protein